MNKLNLLMVAGLLCSSVAMASPISKQKALAEAQRFLQAKGIVLASKEASYRAPRRSRDQLSQDAYYYIFNAGHDKGFVIVSGDDQTLPVLGYSDRGSFDIDRAPDHVKAWLQGYADEIAYMQQHRVQVVRSAPAADHSKTDVAPMIQTLWNQGAPYNNLCPTMANGRRTVTGCVATATAQAMSKFSYPDQTFAATTAYTTQSTGLHVASVPANSTLSWADMLPRYIGSETAGQQTAIAQLLHYVGAAVQMDYGETSAAVLSKVAGALQTQFGYKSSTRSVARANYTLATWTDLIYDELKDDRPVIYGGQSSGGGHAFVVDGYRASDGMFHINWGWGGQSDGYYALSVLEPGAGAGIGASSTADGYTGDQDAIVGIVPGNASEEIQVEVKTSNSNIAYNGQYISAYFWNYTGVVHTFEVGLAVWNDGEVSSVTSLGSRNVENYHATIPGMSRLSGITAAGTYKIVPVSRLVGEDKWKVNDDPTTCMAEVTTDRYGQIQQFKVLSASSVLSVTDVQFSGTKSAYTTQPVEVTIANAGSEYYGYVYLFASQSGSRGNSYASRTSPTIVANGLAKASLSFLPTEVGTWNVWITDKDFNTLKQTSVDIVSTENNSKSLLVREVGFNTALTAAGRYVYPGNRAKGTYAITNNDATNDYVGSIAINLHFNADGGSGYSYSNSYLRYVPVTLAPGETKNIEVDYNGLMARQYYRMVLYRVEVSKTGSGVTSNLAEIHRTGYNQAVANGETYKQYMVDGASETYIVEGNVDVKPEATYVDLSGVDASLGRVRANANPNTLYVVAENAIVPSTLKNVIKGGVAENITLVDGYNFATPVDFTATSIEYRRTFAKGSNGNADAWETVVLPFEVTEVQKASDGTVLTWFSDAADADGNFWLRGYTGIAGHVLDFVSSERMEANKPYIISVPYDRWGEKWNLVGHELVFKGAAAVVKAAAPTTTTIGSYEFVGAYTDGSTATAYILNDAGTRFVRTEGVASRPFRACVKANAGNAVGSLPPYLTIGSAATGIRVVDAAATASDRWYNLKGMEVDGRSLPAGVYIHGGKKVIVK